jgi:MFS family permease
MVAGSFVQVLISQRYPALASAVPTILAATFMIGLGYTITGLAPTLLIACLASVIGGIGNGVQVVTVETRMHALVSEEMRARASALLGTLIAIAPGIGILLGGVLTAVWSARVAYVFSGLGLGALVLLAAIMVLAQRNVPPAEPALDTGAGS